MTSNSKVTNRKQRGVAVEKEWGNNAILERASLEDTTATYAS